MKKAMKRAIAFGNYLAEIRNERNYSVRQLGYMTNVNSSYISQLEHHKRTSLPKISTINKLAAGLHVSPSRMYQLVGVKDIHRDNIFRKNLKRIRHEQGFTMHQLAYIANVSTSSISNMEKGKRGIPTFDTLIKLAHALKVSPNDLLPKTSLSLSTNYVSDHTTVDLRQLINHPIKLSWGTHPVESNDLMAISLWFKTKLLSKQQDVLGLFKLGFGFKELCKKYHINRFLFRQWLKDRPNYPKIKREHLTGRAKINYRRRLFPKCLDLLLNHHQDYVAMVKQYRNGFTAKKITQNSHWSNYDLIYLLKNRDDYRELLAVHKKALSHRYDTVIRKRKGI